MNPIEELSPKGVWKNFYALTQIPHPSGQTEQIAAYLVEFAKANGAEAHIDEAGNVIMTKGATPGYEDRETTVLQAHMDMVPQKTKDSPHNFATDPLDVYIDNDWVKARNTTLGADNGIGVAAAMAIIEDSTIEHGPIEVLITRDEETGLEGAFGLKAGELSGKYLLNLDSEEEGEITIGCAGGVDILCNMTYQEINVEPSNMLCYNISIKGLLGGHSGIEICKGRANANKLLCRFLARVAEKYEFYLCDITGGSLHNAIPREACALCAVQHLCRRTERPLGQEKNAAGLRCAGRLLHAGGAGADGLFWLRICRRGGD